MKFTSKLAGLKCPNCGILQPYGELIKTRPNLFGSLENTVCSNCSAKLWIEEGRGILQMVLLLVGMFFWVPLCSGLIADYFNTFDHTEFIRLIDKGLRFLAVGLGAAFLIFPLSARVYKVGHSL